MSCSRRCDIYLATNGSWYMILGNFEYAQSYDDCTVYGPFRNRERIDAYLFANHSNPGGMCIDESGVEPPPENPVSPAHR